jgi:hypothetical protein
MTHPAYPDLARVVEAGATLPEPLRRAVLAMVNVNTPTAGLV